MLTMYNAGIIGNFGVQHLLAQQLALTANRYRKEGTPPYEAKDFVPDLWDFISPPKTKEEEANLVQQRLAMVGNVPPQMMLEIMRKNSGH